MLSKILIGYALLMFLLECVSCIPWVRKQCTFEIDFAALQALILLAIAVRYITGY